MVAGARWVLRAIETVVVTSVGDYELEGRIGAGGSGTVWKAHRPGPVTRVVALKRLHPGSSPVDLSRLRREATLLTELDHPHVVRILEVIEDGDGLAIAMQFAPGGSLEALLAERGRLAPGEVVAVAAPIADALASAHRRGVLHGDVKPANVLFTSDGEPLLSDFGVARTLGRLTSDNIAGTAHYMAPEMLDGAPPDARADVYSLGVVCYEALTGRPPFDGAVPLAVVRAADSGIHGPLVGLTGLPHSLAQVVEQAMARDPEHRFPTADSFARALRGALAHDDTRLPGIAAAAAHVAEDAASRGTRSFGPRPPRREKTGRQRFRLPATFFVMIFLAVGLYLVRGPLRPDEPCPEVEEPVVEPGAMTVVGDPEGDGCETYGVYRLRELEDGRQLMLLEVRVEDEPRRIAMGELGDQVFLGDWDCDDVDTPAIYRRNVGGVDYFNTWPEEQDEETSPDLSEPTVPGGVADVAESDEEDSDGRCDRIEVTPTAPDA